MTDLSCDYLGLSLPSPIVVSSSGLTGTVKGVQQCAEAGAGAVVLKSLFEEQIDAELESSRTHDELSAHPEAADYVERLGMQLGAADYLELIAASKRALSVPVIASVNCVSHQWWTDYASQIQEAGADALELNISVMPRSFSDAGNAIEQRFVDIVASVRESVSIPLSVKIGPYFTALPEFILRLQAAGSSAFVLFNRFYHFDIDVDHLKLKPGYHLSQAIEQHTSLRWISILSGNLSGQLAASTGVASGADAAKMLLAGASVVQVASALYRNGISHISALNEELSTWMEKMGFSTIASFRGRLSQKASEDPVAYERLQYIKALTGAS